MSNMRRFKCGDCGAEFEEPYGTGLPVCPKCGSSNVYRVDEGAAQNNAGINVARGTGRGLGRGAGRGLGRGAGRGLGRGGGRGMR